MRKAASAAPWSAMPDPVMLPVFQWHRFQWHREPAGSVARFDVYSSQPCLLDNTAQRPAVIRADRVAVTQGRLVDDKAAVRGEYAEVGAQARGERATVSETGKRGRGRGHPADDPVKADSAARGLGPHRWQAELERRDAAPCLGEIPPLRLDG